MKISELKNHQKEVNIELKVIYDRMNAMEKWGHRIKTLVVVDADSTNSENTALLDVYDKDIDRFKFQDKLKVVNGYAKRIKTHRNGKEVKQLLINYGFENKIPIGHYENIG